MNVQSLLAFTPFLSLLYVLFAVIQLLRKKQQGIGAALLAFIVLVVPLAALLLNQDNAARTSLVNYLTLNAIIVFVASIIIRQIEGRNSSRDPYRSYGMTGMAFSVLMALEILAYPTVIAPGATFASSAGTGGFGAGSSEVLTALTAQTGLTAEEITSQVQSGTKIADLVKQHNGDLNAVITAAASALDAVQTQGGRFAQVLSSLGSNSTDIATQFVQGTLAAQGQLILTGILLGGGRQGFGQTNQNASANGGSPSTFSQGGQNASGGSPSSSSQSVQNPSSGLDAPAGFTFPGQSAAAATAPSSGLDAPAGFTFPGQAPVGSGGANSPNNSDSAQVASVPTGQPTDDPPTPTETAARPTLIAFPTPTPTPDAAQQPSAEATQEPAATCTVTPFYNLNLRDKPNTNNSKIYLSIPYGTPVSAAGRTKDDWYSVTYNGQAGWISGEYVSTDGTCDSIPVVSAD
jgi:Bacterial SH3 domain